MPTHYSGSRQETLALDTFIKLTRATDSVVQRLWQTGSSGDLTVTQFGTLEVLYHLGPMCQYEISAKLLKSTGNLSLVLRNLEKRGLIFRERDAEDRRRVIVSLSDSGRALISELFPIHAASIAEEMGVLNPEEQETLGNLCRKLGKQERSRRSLP